MKKVAPAIDEPPCNSPTKIHINEKWWWIMGMFHGHGFFGGCILLDLPQKRRNPVDIEAQGVWLWISRRGQFKGAYVCKCIWGTDTRAQG